MPPGERSLFLRGLIGRRYSAGATGPDKFDCYGLATLVLRELFETALPARGGGLGDHRGWRQCPIQDGALCMMKNPRGRHVGVYLGPERGMIHALESPGVVFDDDFAFAFRGFARRTFWTFNAP